MTLAHNQMHVNYIVLKSSAACDSYSAICMADEATDSMWQELDRQNTKKIHNTTKQKLLPLCSCSFQHRSWYTVAQIVWLICSIAPGQHNRTTNGSLEYLLPPLPLITWVERHRLAVLYAARPQCGMMGLVGVPLALLVAAMQLDACAGADKTGTVLPAFQPPPPPSLPPSPSQAAHPLLTHTFL